MMFLNQRVKPKWLFSNRFFLSAVLFSVLLPIHADTVTNNVQQSRKLYAQYDCEGRASYTENTGIVTLPFVDSIDGVLELTLQRLTPSQFKVTNSKSATATVSPLLPPCHATLTYDGVLHIPLIDILDHNSLVNATGTLTQLSSNADNWLFNLPNYATPAIQPTRLEPLTGAYFGIDMDWSIDSVEGISTRLGFRPDIFVRVEPFPWDTAENQWFDEAMLQAKTSGVMMLLSLEPYGGLDTITVQVANDFAQTLKKYNDLGVPILVRFAEQMNGSWYPWGQSPTAYIKAFRLLADAVHKTVPSSAMLWSPNYGGGYPFKGGQYDVKSGSSDFTLLDTNKDGQLTDADDPYMPYYPGDDVVDWVGMRITLYSNNQIPETGRFASQLRGEYVGDYGDDRVVPDFYGIYGEKKQKPIAIETAALFAPSITTGADERLIKQLWWRQLLSPDSRKNFPRVKLITWLEQQRNEGEVDGKLVLWGVTTKAEMLQAFLKDLRNSWVGLSTLLPPVPAK